MRLIDADAFERRCLFDENIEDMQDVIYALRDYPTVDATKVVRCKDCKYSHMTFDGECKYCDIWFPDEKTYMDGNYFCASAERREE